MQFGSGILSAEPPVDGDARCVALGLVGRDLALQGVGLGVSPLETGAAQCAEFDLRHVQPTGVLGRVVKLEALHDAPGLSSRERLVKGRHTIMAEHCSPDANRNRELDRAFEILDRTCECGNDKITAPDGSLADRCRECQDLDRRGLKYRTPRTTAEPSPPQDHVQ